MAKDPAVLFYTSDFLAGTILFSLEETGAYIKLLCIQREQGHLTRTIIDQICGKPMPRVIEKFTQDEDGLYYNERMEVEKEKRNNYTASRRENGLKGGRPKTICKPYGKPYANHMGNHMGNRNKDIIRDKRGMGEEEEEEGRKNSPNKGTSKAFIPPTLEEVREYARSKDCEDIADRFYEYFTDGEWKDSAGKPVRSWKQKLLTWRNKEPAKNKPPDNKPMKYGTFDPTEALNNAIRRTFENIPKRGADNGS